LPFRVVIDLDNKNGKNGIETWQQEFGALPDTQYQTTPNNGYHYLFAYPETLPKDVKLGCTVDKLGTGIDTRGEGGAFVAALSPGYEWSKHRPKRQIQPIPDYIIARFRKKSEQKEKLPTTYSSNSKYKEKALEGIISQMEATPEGVRDSTLNALAYRIGRMVAKGKLEEPAGQILMNHKGYTASIHYSEEDGCLVGEVIGINHITGFHGETLEEIRANFIDLIDDYPAACAELGIEPNQPPTEINLAIPNEPSEGKNMSNIATLEEKTIIVENQEERPKLTGLTRKQRSDQNAKDINELLKNPEFIKEYPDESERDQRAVREYTYYRKLKLTKNMTEEEKEQYEIEEDERWDEEEKDTEEWHEGTEKEYNNLIKKLGRKPTDEEFCDLIDNFNKKFYSEDTTERCQTRMHSRQTRHRH
jgi:predicted HicB family RNase H-like nuclease